MSIRITTTDKAIIARGAVSYVVYHLWFLQSYTNPQLYALDLVRNTIHIRKLDQLPHTREYRFFYWYASCLEIEANSYGIG